MTAQARPLEARGASVLREMREIVRDSFEPRPLVYWTDLLATLAVAYPATLYFLLAPGFGLLHGVAYGVAGFAVFRAGSFIHELQHVAKERMPLFRAAWNLACGIPLLMPSNMYDNHVDHHSSRRYGTERDGEYLPLGTGGLRDIAVYLLQVPLLPLFAVLRFAVLAPLSALSPRLRRFVLERASSYGINPRYRREIRPHAPRRAWALIDAACFLWIALLATLLVRGTLPWVFLPKLYALVCFTIGLNWLRNLAAHRFRGTGESMDYLEQLEDSVTITGHPILSELFFPVGLRYHSLHHLFPGIPYHELGRAHRRLVAELPPDAAYRRTIYPGLRSVVGDLVAGARRRSEAAGSRAG